jgi:hypothetical protein
MGAARRIMMSRKRHKPEAIGSKLRQVDVVVSQGQSVQSAPVRPRLVDSAQEEGMGGNG